MDRNIFKITDQCRKGLNKYTTKAFSNVPKMDKPKVLDMGCGTGVSTLALMDICDGDFFAVDSDETCLAWLKEKVDVLGWSDRIQIIHASALDKNLFDNKFDIVIAEGLLNVIGFDNGLLLLMQYLKDDGYLLIHDELKNDSQKRMLFEEKNLELTDVFEMDENVWWNDYFCCLEQLIQYEDNVLFKEQIAQIEDIKNNSQEFKSIYYVLKNG